MNFIYREALRIINLIDAKIDKILERDFSLVMQSERSVGLWYMTFGYDLNYKSTKKLLSDLENNRKKIESLIHNINSEEEVFVTPAI